VAGPKPWDDIVRDHYPAVYRWALRLTGNTYDAEDLSQETFFRALRSLDRYVDGSFEAWLRRIATNLFVDHVRRAAKFTLSPLDPELHSPADPAADPAVRLEASGLDGEVGEALRQLPGEYRDCLVACDVEGRTYEDAAATLGVKVGTVRSRLHRGRAALRRELA
jgi:RNA polymerase sigma-70 factor (ECF subfamily)